MLSCVVETYVAENLIDQKLTPKTQLSKNIYSLIHELQTLVNNR